MDFGLVLFPRHDLATLDSRQRLVDERLGPCEIVVVQGMIEDGGIEQAARRVLDRGVVAAGDMIVDPGLLLGVNVIVMRGD